MKHHIDRRDMLKTTAAIGAGVWLGTTRVAESASANETLNIALIGVGGRGRDNLNGIARTKQNIVALCDVDDKRAGNAYSRFPKAKKFADCVGLTGLFLAKLDGTAKGGVVVAIWNEIKIPVKYVGVGEGIDDILPFDPESFVDALFGEELTADA